MSVLVWCGKRRLFLALTLIAPKCANSSTQVSKSFATVLREATTSVVLTNLVSYSDPEYWKLPALNCYLLVKVFFSKVTLLRVKLMQVRYVDGWWWKAEKEMYQSITKKEEKKIKQDELQVTLLGRHTVSIRGIPATVYVLIGRHYTSLSLHPKSWGSLAYSMFYASPVTLFIPPPPPTLRCCRLQP